MSCYVTDRTTIVRWRYHSHETQMFSTFDYHYLNYNQDTMNYLKKKKEKKLYYIFSIRITIFMIAMNK